MNNADYFLPHAHCVFNDLRLIVFNSIGNILTATAYLLIPLTLGRGLLRLWLKLRHDERALVTHGALFILLCGLTHIMDFWNWTHADYWAQTWVVLATGVVSISFSVRLRKSLLQRLL